MLVINDSLCLTYTRERVLRDFEMFRRTPSSHFVTKDREWHLRPETPCPQKMDHLLKRVTRGQMLSEFFHWGNRMAPSTYKDKSARQMLHHFIECPEEYERLSTRIASSYARTSGRTFTPVQLKFETVRVKSALLTMTHFRASVSKYFCDIVSAHTVLDFSAGWGDRLTGFLASDTVERIVLIDPRKGSIINCHKQHEFVNSSKNLKTYARGAEEVLPELDANVFDLIISSPPYFNLEHYGETDEERRGQIRDKVKTVDAFINVFLKPVLLECARVLKPGGTLVLNLDDCHNAKHVLCRPALDILSSVLQLQGTAGLRKGNGYGKSHQKTAAKSEPLYIFKKCQASSSSLEDSSTCSMLHEV